MMKKGFTIVEVMVGAVLLVALGVGIVGLQYVMSKGQVTSMDQFLIVNESNFAVGSFAREIRTARSGDNGTYLMELADNQEIIFYSDIDVDGQSERVRYYLSGTDLVKSVIEPMGTPASYPPENAKTKTIAQNVRNGDEPVFYYYNSDWPGDTINNPLPTPADLSEIRVVQIFLRLNTRDGEPEKDYILNTFSQIRTRKDNL